MRKRTKSWICSRVEDTASEAKLVAFQAGDNFLVSRKRTGGVIGQKEHFTQVTVQETVAHLKEETPCPEMKVNSSYVKDGDPVVKVGYGCEGFSHGNGFRLGAAPSGRRP